MCVCVGGGGGGGSLGTWVYIIRLVSKAIIRVWLKCRNRYTTTFFQSQEVEES